MQLYINTPENTMCHKEDFTCFRRLEFIETNNMMVTMVVMVIMSEDDNDTRL